jgi:AcrR family transcriptional regulator
MFRPRTQNVKTCVFRNTVVLTMRAVKMEPMSTRPYGGVSATERVAARRERLLDAGLELFGTRGFAHTGVKELCRQAGLTDRYFYESFRDSRALFVAVFDRVCDELFTAVARSVVAVEPAPEPQLRAAVGTFVRALADDPRRARIVFSEAGGAGPEVEQHLRRTLRRFTDLVVATARQHLPPGVSDARVEILALSLVGTLERVVVEWQDGRLELGIDGIVDEVTDLFVTFFR